MRLRDADLAERLEEGLESFSREHTLLKGIQPHENKISLVKQLVDSIRRVKYVHTIRARELSPKRQDPSDRLFDPIMSAVLHTKQGDTEEAAWLVFLATHFGKHRNDHWELTRAIYGELESGTPWCWTRASYKPDDFSKWIASNADTLKKYRFGNHRKYESLNPAKSYWTGEIIESYVRWIMTEGSHHALFLKAFNIGDHDPKRAFSHLYKEMSSVKRFGRTAKFDYLTMLAKVGVVDIESDSAYITGSTGPIKGARLLIEGGQFNRLSPFELDDLLVELGLHLEVNMQVMEDALCNWQKSPSKYLPFRG